MRSSAISLFCIVVASSPALAESIQSVPVSPDLPSFSRIGPRLIVGDADSGQTGLAGVLIAVTQLQQQRSRSTYEDVLAALSQPIRFYDFNNDGLSAAELDVLDSYYAARTRAEQLTQFLARDLNNDRQVTLDEMKTVSRLSIGSDGGVSDMLMARFLRADTNGDGVLTWDEMSAPPSQSPNGISAAIRATTIAADPTPDSNFTLDDARTLTDRIFAAYDTDRNGVLDTTELRRARPPG